LLDDNALSETPATVVIFNCLIAMWMWRTTVWWQKHCPLDSDCVILCSSDTFSVTWIML